MNRKASQVCFMIVATLILSASLVNAETKKPVITDCGGPPPDYWQSCEQPADCILVTALCGIPVPYNRAWAEKVHNYATCMAPTINCSEVRIPKAVGRPLCIENACTASY